MGVSRISELVGFPSDFRGFLGSLVSLKTTPKQFGWTSRTQGTFRAAICRLRCWGELLFEKLMQSCQIATTQPHMANNMYDVMQHLQPSCCARSTASGSARMQWHRFASNVFCLTRKQVFAWWLGNRSTMPRYLQEVRDLVLRPQERPPVIFCRAIALAYSCRLAFV